MFGLSAEQWTIISSIASMVSAIGTCAAVIVAIYIWRRDKTVDVVLNGWASQTSVGMVGPRPAPLCLRLVLSNRGLRNATLTYFAVQNGRLRSLWRDAYVIFPENEGERFKPLVQVEETKALNVGKSVTFDVPLSQIEDHLNLRCRSGWLMNAEVYLKLRQTWFFVFTLERSGPTFLRLNPGMSYLISLMIRRKWAWEKSVA